MEQPHVENGIALAYPLLGTRVQSTFIDTLVIILLMYMFSFVLDHFDNVPDGVRIALFVFVFGVYEPLCTTLGCTAGNYIKGIRVRKFADPSQRINFAQALLRYVVKVLLGWVSFLTIHSNAERRAIHDYASGSIMIEKQG